MSKRNIDIKSAFYMEPEEIIKYFESKDLKVSFDWHEVYEGAHARAFTIAKMMDADLLKDSKELLSKAIKEGWSEGHYLKEAKNFYQKRGWYGKKEMTDPKTGETKEVQLGSSRRLKTIFRTNMTSAYSVGRYKQQMEDADIAPYLQYMCVLDESTRTEHRAMHGRIFRYDDPIWSFFYPPNGWNCRCFVRSLTKGEVERRGLKVESSDGFLSTEKTTVGNRDEEIGVYKFDNGGKLTTLKAAAGFSTNMGANSTKLDLLAYEKIKNFNWGIKGKIIDELNENPVLIKDVANKIEKAILEVKKGRFHFDKEVKTLAWLTPDILIFLEKNKLKNTGAILTLNDFGVGHFIRTNKNQNQILTYTQARRMVNTTRKPKLVFYDIKDPALVYVDLLPKNEIENNKNAVKYVFKPKKNKTKKSDEWILLSAGRINYERDILKQSNQYKKIELPTGGLAFPPSDGS